MAEPDEEEDVLAAVAGADADAAIVVGRSVDRCRTRTCPVSLSVVTCSQL